MNSCQADIQSRLIDIKDEVRNMIQGHDLEFFQILQKKVNITDFNDALKEKADVRQLVIESKLANNHRNLDAVNE